MNEEVPSPVNPTTPIPQQTEVPIKKTLFTKPILVGSIIIMALISAVVIFAAFGTRRNVPTPVLVPILPRPTPTPERLISAVATQSAFITLTEHVSSAAAGLSNFILDDPQLVPPVLELPLGF